MSPSPSPPSSTAESQAFLQLIQRKPPAKVDGFLHLVTGMQREDFTVAEQKAMAESESGQYLAQALRRCEPLRQKATKDASNVEDPERAKKIRADATLKFIDCLSYVACTEKWKQYTECWSRLGGLDLSELQALKERGSLDSICYAERHALETCVGNLVTNTVQASDSAADQVFPFEEE